MVRGRSVGLDFDRRGVVLAPGPGERIEIMLAHVAQAAAFIIPIPAVRAADAVRMIRLHRRRAHIHVPIKIGRHRLRFRVHQPAPLLHLQSAALDDDRFAFLEQTALHDFAGQNLLRIRLALKRPNVPIWKMRP